MVKGRTYVDIEAWGNGPSRILQLRLTRLTKGMHGDFSTICERGIGARFDISKNVNNVFSLALSRLNADEKKTAFQELQDLNVMAKNEAISVQAHIEAEMFEELESDVVVSNRNAVMAARNEVTFPSLKF